MPGIPVKHMPHRKTFLIVEEEKLTCCPEHYYEVPLMLWPVFLLNDYILLSLILILSTNMWVPVCGGVSPGSPSLGANM